MGLAWVTCSWAHGWDGKARKQVYQLKNSLQTHGVGEAGFWKGKGERTHIRCTFETWTLGTIATGVRQQQAV